jgi:integrase
LKEVRPLIEKRLNAVGHDPAARIFTGPRGGRITTAVLRDATHWDEVVTQLGYEHLRRHDLRHSFTVASLLDLYRDGGDVQARLPLLSTWLGHVDPKSTYWYYSDSRVIPTPAPSRA